VPELKGKATVLLVRDVEQTLAYYRDQLGFAVERFEENPTHYGYANRGECYVDNIPALHEEFTERGADLLHGPEKRPWTSLEIRIRDPDGHVLAFGQLD
jgi:catechol 2,3-dioxygenase-like lactoylglutathione lyase family enzyme